MAKTNEFSNNGKGLTPEQFKALRDKKRAAINKMKEQALIAGTTINKAISKDERLDKRSDNNIINR